jgi:hypothetical protein
VKHPEERSPNRRLNARTPRWVQVFGIIGVVMVLVFVLLHLAGLGPGAHMHHTP